VGEDATAAGDASLDVHAASVSASIRDAIENERKRAAIAQSVLSISLLIFLGLVVFYVVQKIGDFARRARTWIEEHGERVLAVRIRRIEVVSPGTVRSTALIGLSVGKWIAQVAVVYVYVVYGALARFEATRAYSQRLTGLVVSPLSDLLARIAVGLPMLVVLAIAGFAVFVLVRFVGLYFSSVGRREAVVAWIPSDLVAPVSSLVRFAIVVTALVFLVPLVTGSSEGALARSGWVVVVALGLAATPVLANGLVGAVVLFGRKLRTGHFVELGAYRGRIASIGLLELCLEDENGTEIRVPHLYTLVRPTRIYGLRPRFTVELAVGPSARGSDVRAAIARVAATFDADHRAALLSTDTERALYRVSFSTDRPSARSELVEALVGELATAKIPLGRLRSVGGP
jgi:small-conductance mechanosensitive channel